MLAMLLSKLARPWLMPVHCKRSLTTAIVTYGTQLLMRAMP